MQVCRKHIKKALESIPAPHVQEIPKNVKKTCCYCDNLADLNLFLFNSSKTNEFELSSRI